MNNEIEIYDRIESYLNNEMTPEERLHWEHEVESDPGSKEAMDFFIHVRYVLDQELHQEIKRMVSEEWDLQSQSKNTVQSIQNKTTSRWPGRWMLVASIVLLISFGVAWFLTQQKSDQQLLLAHAVSYNEVMEGARASRVEQLESMYSKLNSMFPENKWQDLTIHSFPDHLEIKATPPKGQLLDWRSTFALNTNSVEQSSQLKLIEYNPIENLAYFQSADKPFTAKNKQHLAWFGFEFICNGAEVYLSKVDLNSPNYSQFRPLVNQKLIRLNGNTIYSYEVLYTLFAEAKPGDSLSLIFQNDQGVQSVLSASAEPMEKEQLTQIANAFFIQPPLMGTLQPSGELILSLKHSHNSEMIALLGLGKKKEGPNWQVMLPEDLGAVLLRMKLDETMQIYYTSLFDSTKAGKIQAFEFSVSSPKNQKLWH